MSAIAYVNGRFSPIEEAVVSVEDRGFQLGDGVYDVLRTYNGRLNGAEAHLQRLFRSLASIDIKHDFTVSGLTGIFLEAIRRGGFAESVVYIQITRGATKRKKEFPRGVPPTLVVTIRELELPPASLRKTGVRIMTTEDIRWQRCDIKSVCLLANVLASQRAKSAGCHEALFVEKDGTFTECASSNIFIIKNGTVITAGTDSHILGGITREQVIAVARKNDIPVEERRVKVEELFAADEVFVTGTLTEILPVIQVDDKKIGTGKPGPLARQLHEMFLKAVTAE